VPMDVPRHQDLINSASLDYIEELYLRYLDEPGSVPEEWRDYFASRAEAEGPRPTALGPSFRPRSLFAGGAPAWPPPTARTWAWRRRCCSRSSTGWCATTACAATGSRS